jgi:TRAP-type uncharacterized transport system substrate-binding protein
MKKLVVLIMVLFSIGHAQQEIAVADGSSSGIYQQIFKEMVKTAACDQVSFTEVASTGALDNLDKVVSNEANACFVHSDILAYRSKTEDLSNIKTLLALFSEDVHFLALNKPWKYGGTMGMMQKEKIFEQISDLDGFNVGAAGGGFITANVVRIQGEIAYKVIQYNSGAEVLAALNKGEIAAAIFVGAAPLPNIKPLGKEYKLLMVGDASLAKLKSVYHKSTISYITMGGIPTQTIAADCLLITRVYKTPKFANALAAFRESFCTNLDELKETRGTHKAWQQVDCENHGKWAWYTFDGTAPKK